MALACKHCNTRFIMQAPRQGPAELDPEELLMSSLRSGNIQELKQGLEKHASRMSQDSLVRLWREAVAGGSVACMKVMEEAGMDITTRFQGSNGTISNALYESIRNKRIEVVEYLLQGSSVYDQALSLGSFDPVTTAVMNNADDIFYLLVNHLNEHEPELMRGYCFPALQFSIKFGKPDLVNKLLRSTQSQNEGYIRRLCEVSLQQAMSGPSDEPNILCIQALVSQSVKPSQDVLEYCLHLQIAEGNLALVRLLIDNGAPLRHTTTSCENNTSSIMVAVINRRLEIAKYLLSLGCILDQGRDTAQNPLHIMVRQQVQLTERGSKNTKEEMISFLLENGVNVHHHNARNCLSIAAKMLDATTTSQLLEAGADPFWRDDESHTVIDHLLLHTASASVIYSKNMYIQTLKALIKHGSWFEETVYDEQHARTAVGKVMCATASFQLCSGALHLLVSCGGSLAEVQSILGELANTNPSWLQETDDTSFLHTPQSLMTQTRTAIWDRITQGRTQNKAPNIKLLPLPSFLIDFLCFKDLKNL